VVAADGEPHAVRTDLTGALGGSFQPRGPALLAFGHMTDLHVTDVESPARFEFLNRFRGDARFRELLPMHRPQEALNVHAIDAMVRAFNSIDAAPVTGSPLDLLVMSGDAADNAQANELATFMALFDGGLVSAGSGGPELEGVQAPGWQDDLFWKPDGGAYGRDQFRVLYGFPHLPGLLDRCLRAFEASGLRLPWIGCHGNHEVLCQGVGAVTPELARAMVGGRKPIALPESFDLSNPLETFIERPQAFMGGPTVAVTPDAARAPAGIRGFIEAHFRGAARPDAHGFTPSNRRDGTAYYVHDTPAIRLITLDTACRAGGADGTIDREQLQWLEQSLIEVHAPYTGSSGETIRTSAENRLVVIVSHHPAYRLRNPRAVGGIGGNEVLNLLHRFPNVVLWVNGHLHVNRIQAHANREGVGVGFWEVTTSSLVDWPCQGRVIEIFEAGGGRLGIACTMVDHDGEPDPAAVVSAPELAGLHRQLAANDPLAGMGSPRAGTPADRNVILALPAPFPLNSLSRR
jgi:metallophosphoesterase (TIGR03767 family)